MPPLFFLNDHVAGEEKSEIHFVPQSMVGQRRFARPRDEVVGKLHPPLFLKLVPDIDFTQNTKTLRFQNLSCRLRGGFES